MDTTLVPRSAEGARTGRRVALVTGGGRGLGAAIGAELAGAGIHVVVADLDAATADASARRIQEAGHAAEGTALDVADTAAVAAALDSIAARLGRLDILVNNAGTDVTAPFDDIDADDWDRVIRVNLLGPANMTRAALPLMGTGGDIVNITSTAAKRAWANASAYHASKWGLLGFSHAMHAELRSRGIRVTAIVCGGMRTPFLLDRFSHLDPERLMDPSRVAAGVRWAIERPRDVAVAEMVLVPLTEESWP